MIRRILLAVVLASTLTTPLTAHAGLLGTGSGSPTGFSGSITPVSVAGSSYGAGTGSHTSGGATATAPARDCASAYAWVAIPVSQIFPELQTELDNGRPRYNQLTTDIAKLERSMAQLERWMNSYPTTPGEMADGQRWRQQWYEMSIRRQALVSEQQRLLARAQQLHGWLSLPPSYIEVRGCADPAALFRRAVKAIQANPNLIGTTFRA